MTVRLLHTSPEKLPAAVSQPASVNQLACEPEVFVDADDQQLLEIALALDEDMGVALLGRDGLHLDELAGDGADANDVLYQWEAPRDWHSAVGLERNRAMLLAINSADDERNPPKLGVMEREIKRVRNGRALPIPAYDQSVGHGTALQARFWKKEMAELPQEAPCEAK